MLGLRKEERPLAITAAVVFTILNGLLIYCHFDSFTRGARVGFWSVFYNHLCMSGYDVFSLIFISCMRLHWNALRHPLFVAVLLTLYWINHWLMPQTEFNFAVFLMAALLIAADVWGAVLLHRILRDIVGLKLGDATLLTALFYGFAHVMTAAIVPDHFALSLPLLLLALLMTGRHLQRGTRFTWLQQALLFFLTAGVTLTNGVKIALAAWMVNGKKVFSWKSILSFVVPTLMLGAVAKKDPARIERLKTHDAFVKKQNGEALTKDVPLLEWSDMTTSRIRSVVDNLFGESLQFHKDHLMEDVQQTRPVFVSYGSTISYVVEALLVLLLIAGAWVARRQRFFLIVATWFGFDMLMHLGFGFGINEVYIMTAHWAFIIPIAAAYLLRQRQDAWLRFAVAALTIWLWAYNGTVLVDYLLTI